MLTIMAAGHQVVDFGVLAPGVCVALDDIQVFFLSGGCPAG